MKCNFCRKEAKFFAKGKDYFFQDIVPDLGLYVCGECPRTSAIKEDDTIEVIPIDEYIEKYT